MVVVLPLTTKVVVKPPLVSMVVATVPPEVVVSITVGLTVPAFTAARVVIVIEVVPAVPADPHL